MQNQKKAYIYGFSTVLLWSTVASAFKLSLRHLDHVQLLLYANAVSIAVLFTLLTLRRKISGLFTCTPVQYVRSLGLGFLNPFLYYMVLFKAYELLPAQEAQPLNFTWAITLMLLSIPLLKQTIGFYDIFAALISYAGVVVIATRGHLLSFRFSNALGVSLALGSTVIWALFWIYNVKDDRDPVTGLLLNFVFAFPFTLISCLLFSAITLPAWAGLMGALYVGVFEMGLTFVLWSSALRLSSNTAKIGNLIFISPFLSLLLIHIFVGERIFASTFVGLGLIVSGLLMQQIKPKQSH
jgi:drug/metabolite transporter (DMT)-like permease